MVAIPLCITLNKMEKQSKIYIAGHRGLVGSAIVNNLNFKGYTNLIFKTHAELDLKNQDNVYRSGCSSVAMIDGLFME